MSEGWIFLISFLIHWQDRDTDYWEETLLKGIYQIMKPLSQGFSW